MEVGGYLDLTGQSAQLNQCIWGTVRNPASKRDGWLRKTPDIDSGLHKHVQTHACALTWAQTHIHTYKVIKIKQNWHIYTFPFLSVNLPSLTEAATYFPCMNLKWYNNTLSAHLHWALIKLCEPYTEGYWIHLTYKETEVWRVKVIYCRALSCQP